MRVLTIGSLFSGYGGLDRAAEEVFDARTAWVSDIDKGARKVLAYRYPDAPNLGDITTIKWTPDCPTCGELLALYRNDETPEGRGYYCPRDGWFGLDIWTPDSGIPNPVDIITGGSPCQDLSHAGRRAGMTDGTRSNLWVAMREAIAQLKPTYVIWENVHGALSAEAASELEHCPGCMGDPRDRGPVLRALGRVLGDLADLGFNAEWYGLPASDLGACHCRFRVFILAYADGARLQGQPDQARTSPAERHGHPVAGAGRPDLTLLPTPSAGQFNDGESAETWQARRDRVRESANNGNGFGVPLAMAVKMLPTPRSSDTNGAGTHGTGGADLRTMVTLLPTPRATDGTKGGPNQRGSSGDLMLPSAVQFDRWGDYAEAIARHERWIGRPAPDPTEPGSKGQPRLSARFVEFMMAQPDGWITDVPGVTRNEALKLGGNGVVTPQAAHALRVMLARIEAS